MARTNSTHTASPQRWQSPPRSQARQPSEDGSQYEMDLDALGLNSTFESTELEESQRPKIDVVETSDIDGPEDFTMNMTYWMTTDLPVAPQIRSRKEANNRVTEVREDAGQGLGESKTLDSQEHTSEQTANASVPDEAANVPTGTEIKLEESLENDEKVRSYLSTLPGSPLRVPNQQNMLQVPSPTVTKARSLQATVEDYDTPRKVTQETVIHHPPQRIIEEERDALRQKVSELQAQLEQQQLASETRITELETLLSYTRSDLETTRNDTYRQKDQIRNLQSENERLQQEAERLRNTVEDRLRGQAEEFDSKLEQYGEELRLQNLAKLQEQRDEFEQQLQDVENAKRAADERGEERERLLVRMKTELSQIRASHEEELEDMKNGFLAESQGSEQETPHGHLEMQGQLSALQSRAQTLQSDLAKATADARSAREEADKRAALEQSSQEMNQTLQSRVTDLQTRHKSLEQQLEAARTELDSRNHIPIDASDIEDRLECLQKRLEDSRAEVAAKDKQLLQTGNLQSQVETLRAQLDAVRSDAAVKDQQLFQRIEEHERLEERLNAAQGRQESLENAVSALRQQLAEAQRNNAKAQADVEQLELDLADADDRLHDARAEADRRVADVEKKLTKMKEMKLELESKFQDLKSQHDDLVDDHELQMEEVRDRAEDAVRKAGHLLEQERSEKKRLMKELKRTSHEVEQLRAEIAKKEVEPEFSDEESSLLSSSRADTKDTEIENLRLLLRKQSSTLKSVKSETATLRKENTRLKTEIHKSTLTTESEDRFQSELASLRRENEKLLAEAKVREEDFEAINKAMDERLASMLSKVLKQKAKNVVGKRDGQWTDSVGQAVNDRNLMGRALMREWGRQEVGVAPEGEDQGYRYKYVRRSAS